MPNRVDLVVHYLACFKAELIATPLNYRYTATEIDHALRVSGARVLLAHDLRPGDFASLRVCRAGTDKVSTELLTEFAAAAGFPIVEGYGMTEVGLATLNPPSGEIRQGSIGTPIGGYRIELRDDDGARSRATRSGGSGSRRPARWSATGMRPRRPPR